MLYKRVSRGNLAPAMPVSALIALYHIKDVMWHKSITELQDHALHKVESVGLDFTVKN